MYKEEDDDWWVESLYKTLLLWVLPETLTTFFGHEWIKLLCFWPWHYTYVCYLWRKWFHGNYQVFGKWHIGPNNVSCMLHHEKCMIFHNQFMHKKLWLWCTACKGHLGKLCFRNCEYVWQFLVRATSSISSIRGCCTLRTCISSLEGHDSTVWSIAFEHSGNRLGTYIYIF